MGNFLKSGLLKFPIAVADVIESNKLCPVVDENKRLLGLITNSSLVTTMSQQFIDFEEGEA